jgi:rubrerythrin
VKNPKEIIAFAMNMEQQGQKFYESFMHQVDNPDAKKWFEILADTEKEHYEILKKQLDQLNTDGAWLLPEDITSINDPELFQRRQASEAVDPKEQKYSLSDLTVLRMAYLIENDFAEFYKKSIDQVEDAAGKQMLHTLFEWENEHRRIFYDEYKKAMESNWFDQSFAPF